MKRSFEHVATDDRPYSFWVSVGPGRWRWAFVPLTIMAVFFALNDRVSAERGRCYMLGLICGMGYLGMQVTAGDRLAFVSGAPTVAPISLLLVFTLSSVLAYAALSVRAAARFPISLAGSLGLTAFTFLVFEMVLRGLSTMPLSSVQTAVAAIPFLVLPGFFSALAFGLLLRRLEISGAAALPYLFAANGLGHLLGGISTKFVQMEFGAWMALMQVVLCYAVGVVLISFGKSTRA